MVQVLVLEGHATNSSKIKSFTLDELALPLLLMLTPTKKGVNVRAMQLDENNRLGMLHQLINQKGVALTPDRHFADNTINNPEEPDPTSQLSQREFQTIKLMGQGKSVSNIAESLKLSVKTISTYRTRALQKLKLKTTADLIRYVIELQMATEK